MAITTTSTVEEIYKDLLAYTDNLDINEPAPLTHKGVMHFMEVYATMRLLDKKAEERFDDMWDIVIGDYINKKYNGNKV